MKKRLLSAILLLAMLLSLAACGSAAHEVRFELNGGELVSGALLQQVQNGGSAEAPEVRREGYVFDGWSEDLTDVRGNLVAVAQWSPDPEKAVYEVRFELNGGELVSGKLLQEVTAGETAEAPEVKRAGYAFDGWNENIRDVRSNLVAAAMWKRLYSVRFDTAGGEVLSGETEQQVAEGDLPSPPELTRRNYAFSGWSPDVEAVSGDAVYTAVWSAVELRSEEVFQKISPAVVEVEADEANGAYYSLGSGFFIDDQGTFVTNYHVIDSTVSGKVSLTDGSECEIKAVLGYDPALDIAVLQADISGNPYLSLAENGVTTGETIYALGSSEGLTSTFSSGNVSAASRVIDDATYIQITAPISHGNSGGPLVNVFGEVVGINTMAYIEGQNLNFAIDIRELGEIDRSLNLSLAEVFAIQYPNGSAGESSASDDSYYDIADRAEEESNNTFLRADRLENGKILAGELSNEGDLDWFYFTLDKACDVTFLVAPAYVDDMDYLMCGIVRLTEDGDTEVFDSLSPDSEGSFVFMSGTVHFDAPGDYFLVLLLDEGYPFDEPVYYFVDTSW